MPRRKFPTLYPPGLPFGLLRRLGLSEGAGHGAARQVRLPSHTAQAALPHEVTFSPHLDPVVAVLSSKRAEELWRDLEEKNPPGSSSALMDHVPVTSTEQQWDMQGWDMQGWDMQRWEMPRVQHRHPGRLPQCAQFQTGANNGKVLIQRFKTTSKSEQTNP